MHMTPVQYWQNFELGTELDIACGFLYDGLRNFRDMHDFREEADIFPVLYNLAVGLERLLKVAVVLLEFEDGMDGKVFEESLISHNHGELMRRVKAKAAVNLSGCHNEFLSLLAKFYKSHRYDRYQASTVDELGKDKAALVVYLGKHLGLDTTDDGFFTYLRNSERIRGFVGKVLRHIVTQLYTIIREAAGKKGLYTHELRNGGKAAKLLLEEDFSFASDDTVWKEVFLFVLNTRRRNRHKAFLKGIAPLDLDIAHLPDFLAVLRGEVQSDVTEQVESALEELDPDVRRERQRMLSLIGAPNVYFD
ncbi:hypothetical protein ABIE56_000419 [Luteibacter sp. 621]